MEMSDESRTTVPVTVNSSALISNCRPLPEDIATLDEGDTGCQYCGVSYLLLSKYDRIVNHVSKLEKELETLKTFAVDHPILLANHAILQDQHKETLESMKEMEHELETAKEEAGRAIRGHHELQLRYTRLTHDFEVMTERNKWMDDSLRGQLRSMAGTLLYARDELGTLRQGFNLLKVNFRNSTDEQFETLKLELESTMLNQLPALIESEANHRVNTIMARSGDVLSSLKDQVAGLKEDLEQADKRYEDLLQEMNSTTEHYEEYIRSNKNVSQEQYSLIQQENENLSKRILELESKLAELQTTKEDLENSLLKEREESTKSMSVLKCALQEKEAKLNALTASFEEERKAIESGGNSAVANINKALAQKDLEILKHQTKITELKTAMAKALEERVQTIEAHQSRVKQLQDKYQQMLKDAETRATSTGKQAVDQETLDTLQKKFEAEKIELLTTQKANFQKQLIEIQRTLQSQVDAARLSRDQTASEFKRKLATLEEDFKIRSEKLKGENDQLKVE
ncbi:hypothetical protein HDU79_008130 [Rhizoclosmatium sp. JEL0117]|nr:hypothetical protein HDU79_008130 [Rhizoclosmatium sp. JEL0117]